jgi:hypothetical protein
MEVTGTNTFYICILSINVTAQIVTKLMCPGKRFVKQSCIEFNENSISGVVAATGPETDRQIDEWTGGPGLHRGRSFLFYFVKNA